MRHLPKVAGLTQSLRVPALVCAATADGNDVIENKFFSSLAPLAKRQFPFSSLKGSEVSAVSLQFTRVGVAKMLSACKHFVSVLFPSKPQCFAHFGSSFRGLFIARKHLAPFLLGLCALSFTNHCFGFIIVDLSPKRIVFSGDGFTPAIRIFASHSLVSSGEVVTRNIEKFSASEAWHVLTGFCVGHGNSDNGVKSVETPLYALLRVRAIPSQAAQECAEGVTTRAWSPERTVKPHERATRKGRDSLSYTGTYRSADKEPHDNTPDEAINIGVNSPISAAQFSITQYAAAVTMSGLEMLQNASKEQSIDLMEGRVKVTEAQLMNRIDYDLYQDGTGNGGKNLTGLALAVADTPTSGTYGGISRSTWAFWQNQYFRGVTDGGAAVSAANIQAYMTTLGLRCVRGNNMPDLWVGDATYYGLYVNSLQAIQRITSDSGSGTAGAGFPALKFYGGGMAADVVFGGGINGAVNTAGTAGGEPAAHMYALNTDYLFFRPHRDRNFVPIGGERQSVNQDAIVKLIGWAGNLTSSGPQFCGVLTA